MKEAKKLSLGENYEVKPRINSRRKAYYVINTKKLNKKHVVCMKMFKQGRRGKNTYLRETNGVNTSSKGGGVPPITPFRRCLPAPSSNASPLEPSEAVSRGSPVLY